MSGSPQAEFDGKAFAAGLSTAPGVYRMYAADDALLYVGKAGALRKRVASYFNSSPKSPRTVSSMDGTECGAGRIAGAVPVWKTGIRKFARIAVLGMENSSFHAIFGSLPKSRVLSGASAGSMKLTGRRNPDKSRSIRSAGTETLWLQIFSARVESPSEPCLVTDFSQTKVQSTADRNGSGRANSHCAWSGPPGLTGRLEPLGDDRFRAQWDDPGVPVVLSSLAQAVLRFSFDGSTVAADFEGVGRFVRLPR